jgi:hypothetical protein
MAKVKLNIEIDDTIYEKLKKDLEDLNAKIPSSTIKTVENLIEDLVSKMATMPSLPKMDFNNMKEEINKMSDMLKDLGGEDLFGGDFANMFSKKDDNKDKEPEKKKN